MSLGQGEEIRKERVRRGWLRTDLADRLQEWEYEHGTRHQLPVDRNYVYRWETGKRGVSEFYAVRLEAVLGIPRDHFIDRRVRPRPGGPPDDEGDSQVDRRAFSRAVLAAGLAATGAIGGEARRLVAPTRFLGTVSAIQDQLLRYDSISAGDPGFEPASAGALERRLVATWHAFQNARYAALGSALPELLASARHACAAAGRNGGHRLAAVLSEAYQLTAILLLKQGQSNLAWVAADRGMLAAERSGDPLTIAGSARIVAYALLGAGHHAKARELCAAAAAHLQRAAGRGDPDHLSAYGALLLKGSVAAAKQGDRAVATEWLDEASAAARRLGRDANHRWTAFGPTNVAVHRVSAAVDLGDAGTAIDQARGVVLQHLPVVERRAHHLVDVAAAYRQWGKDREALGMLLAAERLAPEEIRVQAVALDVAADLLQRAPRRVPELRALARRIGIAS